ncbi:MAG: aldo/keto reductase [Thermoplasmata archaeon]|nr:aldo/keto reductase [Thermoplasmata archaeon]
MPLLGGLATREGTAAYRDRGVQRRKLPPSHFREAPGQLALSSFGLGTYIGRPDGPTDLAVEQAVALCIASGRVNVFDTAINYRYQRAERSVGRSLTRAISDGTVARSELFVSTKNGYLAPDGESDIAPELWVDRELIRGGVLRPSEIVDGSHAMSPSFLADQLARSSPPGRRPNRSLARSQKNLGLESIDLMYLHNAADAQLPVVGHDEFFARLAAAFAFYETERKRGTLGAYGLATWDCLRVPRSEAGHLSLEEVVRLAEKVGGPDHGFRYLQFPFNLAMPEAARLRTQTAGGDRLTLFEAARKLGVAVFTSVPLFQGQLAREGPSAEPLSAAQTALQFARSVPGTLGPLVGQKTPEHLAENLKLADSPPWDEAEFRPWVT